MTTSRVPKSPSPVLTSRHLGAPKLEQSRTGTGVSLRTAAASDAERCATDEISSDRAAELLEQARKIVAVRSAKVQPNSKAAAGDRVIDVHFHVIRKDNTLAGGNISQAAVEQQIATLNAAYAPTGFSFRLASLDRTTNPAWFTAGHGSPEEEAMKRALRQGEANELNFYTSDPGDALGWATFPWSQQAEPEQDGVVVRFDSLPGGALADYNEGDTATHEVGHWMGLFHTFQQQNDGVVDTPPHRVNFGKPPEGTDTDPRPGLDPIHNYMNYSDDAWLNEFSAQQLKRMETMFAAYRDESVVPVDPRPQRPLGYILEAGGGRFDAHAVLEDENLVPTEGHGITGSSVALFQYSPNFEQLGVGENDIAATTMFVRIDGVTQASTFQWTTDADGKKVAPVQEMRIPSSAVGEMEVWFENSTTDGRKIWDSKFGDNYDLNIIPYVGSTILFGQGWSEVLDSEPLAGNHLQMVYDPDRISEFLITDGITKKLEAYVSFDGREPTVHTIAEVTDGERSPMRAGIVEIPTDARRATIWFKATVDGAESWDSDFGQNYSFDIAQP